MRAHLKQLIIAIALMLVVAASTGALPLLIERSVNLLQQKNNNFFLDAISYCRRFDIQRLSGLHPKHS